MATGQLFETVGENEVRIVGVDKLAHERIAHSAECRLERVNERKVFGLSEPCNIGAADQIDSVTKALIGVDAA